MSCHQRPRTNEPLPSVSTASGPTWRLLFRVSQALQRQTTQNGTDVSSLQGSLSMKGHFLSCCCRQTTGIAPGSAFSPPAPSSQLPRVRSGLLWAAPVKLLSPPHALPQASRTQQPDWPLKKSRCFYSHRLSTTSHHSHGSKPFTELTTVPPTSPEYLPPRPLSPGSLAFFCHSSQEWRPFFPPALTLRLVSLHSSSCLCSGNIPSH